MYFTDLDAFKAHVETLVLEQGEQLMVMIGDQSADEAEGLIAWLNERQLPFFGGIFPGLIYGIRYARSGFMLLRVKPVLQTAVMPWLFRLPGGMTIHEGQTAIVLADGLSSQFRDIIDTVVDRLGRQCGFLGGGAGFYDMIHRPCLFNSRGLFKDAAILCIVDASTEISVCHGWLPLEGPFDITRSRENVLSELDGFSAMDVYRDVIEEHERITLSHEDFFMFAKDHPFGLLQADGSLVVRDPISVSDEGEITCVADIPSGSRAYVLKGDRRTLLESSNSIAEHAAAKEPVEHVPMLFDCISRAMFLEEEFPVEVANIQRRLHRPLFGALSIGEIASTGEGELTIHNKSTILGMVRMQAPA